MKEIETRKEFRKTYPSRSEYCLDHEKDCNQRSRCRRNFMNTSSKKKRNGLNCLQILDDDKESTLLFIPNNYSLKNRILQK